jgi:hypothetical protein
MPSAQSAFSISLNLFIVIYLTLLLIFVIHAGSAMTKEAQRTIVIISKLLSESDITKVQKNDLMCFAQVIRGRNLHLENVFFRINWKVFLTVSKELFF